MSSDTPEQFTEPKTPVQIPTEPKPTIMPESSRKIPTLDTKLDGPSTYPEWLQSIEGYLDIVPIGNDADNRLWDVVTGDYKKPTGNKPEEIKETRKWKDANMIALLTIRKNVSEDVRARIGTMGLAKDAFEELKKAFEGKMATEFYTLLEGLTSQQFDDRKTTIEEHIAEYERTWNNFVGIMSRVDLSKAGSLGKGLYEFTRTNDEAKTEFLLSSLPAFYSNTVENIRAKDHEYDDAVRKLKQYVGAKTKANKNNRNAGTKDDPIVLKTTSQNTKRDNKNSGKTCKYCQSKGWRGIGHTEEECFSKKKAQQKRVIAEPESETESSDDEGGILVKTRKIQAKTRAIRVKHVQSSDLTGHYQYDTGTTHHMTNELHRLEDVRNVSIEVEGYETKQISICEKQGTLVINHNGRKMRLKDTLYGENYANLISGQRITENYDLQRRGPEAKLIVRGKTVYQMKCDIIGGLWIELDKEAKVNSVVTDLHERYGHISFQTLKSMPECPNFNMSIPPRCKPCEQGKATKPPARNHQKGSNKIRTTRLLERIHADLVGPIHPITPGKKYKYLLNTTDDYSQFIANKPLRKKPDTTDALIEIIDTFETMCRRTVEHLNLRIIENPNPQVQEVQADWGGEFRNDRLKEILKKRGIRYKETLPKHSETNAIIERTNRTIMTMSRTAILGTNGGIPKGRWDKSSGWAAYTKNRIPHKTLNGKAPHEIMFPEKDIQNARSNLRPFGQLVTCYNYDSSDKLSPRNYEARITGYTATHGIYQVLTREGKHKLAKNPIAIQIPNEATSSDESEIDEDGNNSEPDIEPTDKTTLHPAPIEKEKPKRHRKTAQEFSELYGSRIMSRNRKLNPEPSVNTTNIDEDHPTENQARNGRFAHQWAQARETERAQLRQYQVYTIIHQLPEGAHAIDTKWVYLIKRTATGEIEKYKARKVGRGFTQEYGLDYDETYAQMMRPETWRMLILIAMFRGWEIQQWDVVAAYLQANLKHNIYVKDINEKGETEYWKLHKALYGLKQSGHEWYQKIRKIIENPECGLTQCIGDEGTYHENNAILGTHVDDFLAIGTPTTLQRINQSIEHHVELENKGRPTKMLGIEMTWAKNYSEVLLTQCALIEKLAQRHEINGNKNSLPLETRFFTQQTTESSEPCNQTEYQSLIGGLLFITRMTRPEASIQVNRLGRLSSNPSMTNMEGAKAVLQYFQSTKKEGLLLRKPPNLDITIYADAAYGDTINHSAKSQSGAVATMGGELIDWWSRKQDIVTLSITEAEYIADCEGAKDAAALRQLTLEMGLQIPKPVLKTDSEGAMNLSKTPKYSRRSKHIDHRFHYLRQEVNKGNLIIQHIPGKLNPADIMTKLTPMSAIRSWKNKWMGGIDGNKNGTNG
jgi:transposase InsO family protein